MSLYFSFDYGQTDDLLLSHKNSDLLHEILDNFDVKCTRLYGKKRNKQGFIQHKRESNFKRMNDSIEYKYEVYICFDFNYDDHPDSIPKIKKLFDIMKKYNYTFINL
jgi:hypothetical protein